MNKSRSYRLSDEALALIEALAKKQGITQTAALELAIRHEAEREKIKRIK